MLLQPSAFSHQMAKTHPATGLRCCPELSHLANHLVLWLHMSHSVDVHEMHCGTSLDDTMRLPLIQVTEDKIDARCRQDVTFSVLFFICWLKAVTL